MELILQGPELTAFWVLGSDFLGPPLVGPSAHQSTHVPAGQDGGVARLGEADDAILRHEPWSQLFA